MSFDTFEHVVTGTDLPEAFRALRDQARAEYGDRPGQTGTVADHAHVVEVHDEPGRHPVTRERARTLIEREYGYPDTACAIELRTAPGEPRQWLVFGKSHF